MVLLLLSYSWEYSDFGFRVIGIKGMVFRSAPPSLYYDSSLTGLPLYGPKYIESKPAIVKTYTSNKDTFDNNNTILTKSQELVLEL